MPTWFGRYFFVNLSNSQFQIFKLFFANHNTVSCKKFYPPHPLKFFDRKSSPLCRSERKHWNKNYNIFSLYIKVLNSIFVSKIGMPWSKNRSKTFFFFFQTQKNCSPYSNFFLFLQEPTFFRRERVWGTNKAKFRLPIFKVCNTGTIQWSCIYLKNSFLILNNIISDTFNKVTIKINFTNHESNLIVLWLLYGTIFTSVIYLNKLWFTQSGPGKPPTRKRFFASAFIFISGPYGLYTSTKK